MQEVALADLLGQFGVSMAFLIMVGVVLLKYLPKFLDMYMEKARQDQEYYNHRQTQYDEQMNLFGKLVEQSNQVIQQSTAVIERNNMVFQQSVASNERITTALDGVAEKLMILTDDVKAHDRRSEKMNIDIVRIAGRLNAEIQEESNED